MPTLPAERLLAALAALAALGSAAWFALRPPVVTTPAPIQPGSTAYAPTAAVEAPPAGTTWAAPRAQRRGHDWIFEVFTPPEIFYDAATRQFTVTPPGARIEAPPAPFGLTLLAVEHPLYPLQLVGYAGVPGGYQGVFENERSGETVLAGAGREFADLGLTLVSLEVRPTPLELPESTTAHPLVATARVRDGRTGEEVTLTTAGRRFSAAPVATVAPTATPDDRREVREGDTLTIGRARYIIGNLQVDPPSVEVTRQAPDQSPPDRQTLTLASAGEPASEPEN